MMQRQTRIIYELYRYLSFFFPNMINTYKNTTAQDLQKAFDIRKEVFVVEQAVSEEEEWDGLDEIATHFLATYKGEAAGTARWRVTPEGAIKLERFCVLAPFRGLQIGASLVKAVIDDIPADTYAYLHAQIQVVDFYKKWGFETVGEVFEEADILHLKMVRRP